MTVGAGGESRRGGRWEMFRRRGQRPSPSAPSATEARRDRVVRYEGFELGVEPRQDAEGLRQAHMLFVGGVAVVGQAEVLPGAGEPFGAGLVPEGARKALGARPARRAQGDVAPEHLGAGEVTGQFLFLNLVERQFVRLTRDTAHAL